MTRRARTGSKPKPKPKSNRRLPPELHVGLYRTMRRIRAFDEKVAELFEGGEIKGTAHSYVGQEAVAAGVCASLGPEDFMASHHRGHGHCIAKGARLDLMMAELMGREFRYGYLQVGVLLPCIALGPTIVAAGFTLGVMQQIVRAFGRVENSFQYLVNSWTTIVELLSIYKRLQAFEAAIHDQPLPKIDRDFMEHGGDPA